MKRTSVVVVGLIVLAIVAPGCSRPTSRSDGTAPAPERTTTGPAAVEDQATGPVAIQPTTAREREALELAASKEGRQWALAAPDGSKGAAEGEPAIVGYQVYFSAPKGEGSYAVTVIGGRVSRIFGSPEGSFEASEAVLTVPGDDVRGYYGAPPQGEAQKAALEAARAYLKANGYDPGSGGISTIIIAFPRVETGEYAGQYPEVAVYAKKSVGDFASGGPSMRW